MKLAPNINDFLPPDLYVHFFKSYFSLEELASCRLVCKLWNEFIVSKEVGYSFLNELNLVPDPKEGWWRQVTLPYCLIILDTSGSMYLNTESGQTHLEIAKERVIQVAEEFFKKPQRGLELFFFGEVESRGRYESTEEIGRSLNDIPVEAVTHLNPPLRAVFEKYDSKKQLRITVVSDFALYEEDVVKCCQLFEKRVCHFEISYFLTAETPRGERFLKVLKQAGKK